MTQRKLSSLHLDIFPIQQSLLMVVLLLRASAILLIWILRRHGSQLIWDDLDIQRDTSSLIEDSPHWWHLQMIHRRTPSSPDQDLLICQRPDRYF